MKKVFGFIVATSTLLYGGNLIAAESLTTFSVGATVTDACSVTAADLAFGPIDPLVNVSNPTDATTSIQVNCANGTAYSVALDAGQGGTTTGRTMISGSGTLDYSLYRDSNRTANWGNVVGADTITATGTGGSQTLTVYGRVPSGQQTAPAGSYSDTITVTVTY